MENFTFYNQTKLIFGKGQIEKLHNEINNYGKRVLVVIGGGSVKRIGLYDKVMDILHQNNCDIYELAGVEPNPRLTTVYKGVDICKTNLVDFVLAIGGGSVIDASKAICAGAKYEGDVWDFFLNKATVKEALPLGTVLTLAATGTEMNGNSVVTKWDTNEKIALGNEHLYPKFSILDPVYTYTVPKDHTIYGIVDMMAHVFEQYFSHTKNTPIQDQFCESVLRTVIENAQPVLEHPDHYDYRANILYSGTMALNGIISMGMFSMGMDGDWATHGIEHQISAYYDIPHGGGLAIIFPNWMKYVLDDGVEKFKRYAIEVWNVDPAKKTDREIALEGIEKTKEFFKTIGAPTRLQDYGINDEKIDIMAENATKGKTIGQYKKLSKDDVAEILRMCL